MNGGSEEQLDAGCAPTPPGKLLEALDYFIVPDTLRPVGLAIVVMAAQRQKYRAAADHIMATIKKDYMALATDTYVCNTKHIYHVGKESNKDDFWIQEERSIDPDETPLTTLAPFPMPLKEHLQRLADTEFLQIVFNDQQETNYCSSACANWRPWSFKIGVDLEWEA